MSDRSSLSKQIVVASDHTGVEMKKKIVDYLKKNHRIYDLGVHNEERVDYPDVVDQAVEYFKEHRQDLLILICGTGIGVSIAANKKRGILCALVDNVFSAEMARRHNHANCIALPARVQTLEPVEKILDVFLSAVPESGRHQNRVKKILDAEKTS